MVRMAHGVIPPFSDYLVSRDFFEKVPIDRTMTEDVELLGEAANEVVVACEVAQMLQSLTRRAYHDYLAYGFADLRDADGAFPLSERRFVSLLLAVTLDLDGADEALGKLLPFMRSARVAEWRTLVGGAMDSNIRTVENELGHVIKEGLKDVCMHVPEKIGFEHLEAILGRS